MNVLFSSNHVHLCNACYPPSSALLTAGPDYLPNRQEISRLTYYASNHPAKLHKLGAELEKRVNLHTKKTQAGNTRARASLLITLSIFKALAAECRRDLGLLSPTLISSLRIVVTSLSSDLEVAAKAANLLTTWATYTNGHLIGTDSKLTQDYMTIIRRFAELSAADSSSSDHEVRNRTRLIGFAALTSSINSDALYNDNTQYREQISVMAPAILKTVLQTKISILEEQAAAVKEDSMSPYLAEFRTRPAIERRAASIHIHVDGDEGPSMSDVTSACLHALRSIVEHANGNQLDYVIQACLEGLNSQQGWNKPEVCCWLAGSASKWAMYQYRYAVPTRLVESLLETPDSPQSIPIQRGLVAMVATIFNSPVPLINLSTSDIVTNLITIVLRRTVDGSEVELLTALVRCIASLGRHVYYSDQVVDLAAELISRLVTVEAQGIPGRSDQAGGEEHRATAIRALLAGLVGLMTAADKNHVGKGSIPHPTDKDSSITDESALAENDVKLQIQPTNRTRVPPPVWHDTLGLLHDENTSVRVHYWVALKFYLTYEISKPGTVEDSHIEIHPPQPSNGSSPTAYGDQQSNKLFNAIHAHLYTLATSSDLVTSLNIDTSPLPSPGGLGPIVNILPATPLSETEQQPSVPDAQAQEETSTRRSASIKRPSSQSRKVSLPVLQRLPSRVLPSNALSWGDYSRIGDILATMQEQLPSSGLLTGVPMLLALDNAISVSRSEDASVSKRIRMIKKVTARVWLIIGKIWNLPSLVQLAEKTLSSLPGSFDFPQMPTHLDVYPLTDEADDSKSDIPPSWAGMKAEQAIDVIVTSEKVQRTLGLNETSLRRRFMSKWTVDSALKDFVEPSAEDTLRDDVSPLLKISPALMHIENLSLQSLARSSKGVGVTDLRTALEGRNSMSNSALVKAPSISTLDHSPSTAGGDNASNALSPTRSRTRSKKRNITAGTGEVRDVLSRLGIGNGGNSMLKTSFSTAQEPEKSTSTLN